MRRKKAEYIADIFGYLAFFAVFNIVKILPCASYSLMAKITGRLFYYFSPSLKKKAKKNLDAAYENRINPNQKKALIKKVFEKQVFFFFEWALWTKITPERALGLIKFNNIEHLKKISLSKKPVVLVSAHLGNFALMIAALTYKKLPFTWIARDANNQYLARYMNRIRRKKGVYGINKQHLSQAISSASDWLRKGNTLCLLIDQHSGKGTTVDFFGKKVQAPTGPAVFARKYNAQVFGVFIRHKKGFRHTIFVEGPYKLVKTDNTESDYQKNIQLFYERIEHHVKESPEEWFTWLHRRFR
ncbi:MAG: lysophospholipid acyltransferase family protein [Candidatus Omnitrophica bacterium]|nr:lysophospholipid acyltransferase family protein [Candidatus Omnitrophota bacterium]MCM8824545.1 lysophospholipid acyltransferase family protein [Candidatus Omnitrophota bacterium]